MTRGSLTRAGPLPKADQRWRIKVLIGFGAIFVALLVEGIVLYQTTLNNRGIGNGTVWCSAPRWSVSPRPSIFPNAQVEVADVLGS